MNNDHKNVTITGVSFTQLLTILFIALKLSGKIAWSWLWVLSPLWIPVAIAIVLFLVVGIVVKAKGKK